MNLQIWKIIFLLVFLFIFCYAHLSFKETIEDQLYNKKKLKKNSFSKTNKRQINNGKLNYNKDNKIYNCDPIEASYITNLEIKNTVWPLPQSITYGSNIRKVEYKGITFSYQSDCDILKNTTTEYCKKFKN